jgi:LPXTG-motif cell wall-anchored protein
VFLPFKKLGLIIIDEEHDLGYKQIEPAPRYHARDVATYLARIHNAKTLFGSATPAVETYANCYSGKYKLVEDAAPNGYLVAKPVEFEVKATGEVQKVEMFDDYTKVQIAKLEEGNENLVIGAKMHLEDAEGNIVAEWVTTNSPYVISHLLTGKYKLVEDAAPEGYLIAEPIEIEIAENGEVQTFKMYDSVKEDTSADDNTDPDNPQTGDSSNLGLYFGLMFSSLAGIIALTISKKRRNF